MSDADRRAKTQRDLDLAAQFVGIVLAAMREDIVGIDALTESLRRAEYTNGAVVAILHVFRRLHGDGISAENVGKVGAEGLDWLSACDESAVPERYDQARSILATMVAARSRDEPLTEGELGERPQASLGLVTWALLFVAGRVYGKTAYEAGQVLTMELTTARPG